MNETKKTQKDLDNDAEFQRMVDRMNRIADQNKRLIEEAEASKQLFKNPDVFVTLKLGNMIFDDHDVDRNLTTVNSRELGFDDEYEWLISRNKVTTTVRLRYCDALCLIETAEYLHQHDEMEPNIKTAAGRFNESVRKQFKEQGLPAPLRSRW